MICVTYRNWLLTNKKVSISKCVIYKMTKRVRVSSCVQESLSKALVINYRGPLIDHHLEALMSLQQGHNTEISSYFVLNRLILMYFQYMYFRRTYDWLIDCVTFLYVWRKLSFNFKICTCKNNVDLLYFCWVLQ